MPRQRGPPGQRLVNDWHIRFMSSGRIALYAIMVYTIDAHGLSLHSEQRICSELSTSLNRQWDARDDLIDQNVLLCRRPICQLLQLLSL
jgi:hypothetical protein